MRRFRKFYLRRVAETKIASSLRTPRELKSERDAEGRMPGDAEQQIARVMQRPEGQGSA